MMRLRGANDEPPRLGTAGRLGICRPDRVAIGFFAGFLAITLGITWWAARRTRTTEHFYAAGRTITARQNGFALAGDYMSAASFLGIAGLVSLTGFDGLIYSTGWLVGWPVVLFLIAEPLRNLGKYTFADAVPRAPPVPVRLAAAVGTLATVTLYLIAQMVGAGGLIRLLFGCRTRRRWWHRGRGDDRLRALRRHARHHLGADRQGGAAARGRRCSPCWCWRGSTSPRPALRGGGARYGAAVLAPGKLVANPLDAISLGLALMFGTAGLPHILMRFYTVPDARAARASVFYATGSSAPSTCSPSCSASAPWCWWDPTPSRRPTPAATWPRRCWPSCWAAPPSSGSSGRWPSPRSWRWWPGSRSPAPRALPRPLGERGEGRPGRRARELRVARIATLLLGLVAVVLGITFKGQNVAFMVGLAFAIAASGNFPALILSIFWRGATTTRARHRRCSPAPAPRCCSSPSRPRSRWTCCTTTRPGSRSRTPRW
jgi:cation/acetate symporter